MERGQDEGETCPAVGGVEAALRAVAGPTTSDPGVGKREVVEVAVGGQGLEGGRGLVGEQVLGCLGVVQCPLGVLGLPLVV